MRECVGVYMCVRYCVVYFISVLLVFFLHSASVFCLVAGPSGKMLSHCVKLPLDLNLLRSHSICIYVLSVRGCAWVCVGVLFSDCESVVCNAAAAPPVFVCNFICKRHLLPAN